jgi:hypothetical protein
MLNTVGICLRPIWSHQYIDGMAWSTCLKRVSFFSFPRRSLRSTLSETRSPHSVAAPDLVGRETRQKPSDQLPDGRLTCAIAGADVRLACPFPPINARLPPKTICAKKLILRAASNGSACPVLLREIFRFRFFPKLMSLDAVPPHMRGASRSSRTLRRDAVGVSMLQRGCHADEQHRCARSNRVVLIPRRWYQIGDDAYASVTFGAHALRPR